MRIRTWGGRLKALAALLLLVALLAGFAWRYAVQWHPAAHDFPIQGADLTAANGDVDFRTLKASGADFVYLRATEGDHRRDRRFAGYWQDSKDAELRRGAIHVYSFCKSAAEQANNFITTVPREADALPAAVSIDFTSDCAVRPDRAAFVADLSRFLTIVETHTGKPMLLKVSRAVERRYTLSGAIPRTMWNTQPLFQPNYSTRPWRMWQASGIRRVDGTTAPVNWDVVAP